MQASWITAGVPCIQSSQFRGRPESQEGLICLCHLAPPTPIFLTLSHVDLSLLATISFSWSWMSQDDDIITRGWGRGGETGIQYFVLYVSIARSEEMHMHCLFCRDFSLALVSFLRMLAASHSQLNSS